MCADCFAWPFTLLWLVREQLTNSSVYSRWCWLSHSVSAFLGFFSFLFFFFFSTFLFCYVDALSLGFLAAVPLQLCLCGYNTQVPWDRAVYSKHITKRHSTWPIQRSALVKKELQIAPGIWAPQLPTCIQFCCSYLIFYRAFICVYRNNKAIFFSLYEFSQELLPDVFCFHF